MEPKENGEKNITLNDIIEQIESIAYRLKRAWILVLTFSILSGVVGFLYSKSISITYTAKLTFILEDSKSSSSGLGGLASLAGQFGVDVGSSSSGGVLSGDNIFLYFKSPTLAKDVLLSKYSDSSKETLADIYSNVYKLKDNWSQNENIGEIYFYKTPTDSRKRRLYDSLLQKLVDKILSNQFIVSKPDKKASFIDVATTMIDEELAKVYCERIVQFVVSRYISLKISRQKSTVDKLQSRVDSLAYLLNNKTRSTARIQNSSSVLDINPLYKSSSIISLEFAQRDKAILASMYSSVLQNLELAKFTLSQETPVIQIIDKPQFPLQKNKVSKLKNSLLFFFIGFLIVSLYVILKDYLLRKNKMSLFV